MKKVIIFLSLVFFGFVAGKIAARWEAFAPLLQRTASSTTASIEPQFLPSPYTLKNHPFVLIVVGRNNGGEVEKTLASIFSQRYENFRVIYIDDGSDDGSFELARDLIYDTEYLIPTTLTHHEKPMGTLASLHEAIESCLDEEIVVLVGGSDWLAHEWVLERLNQYYANRDLWITYGQFCEYPGFHLGSTDRLFHLQTFYASLFKRIDPSERKDPIMIPMLKMAKGHFQHISDVLYIASKNRETDSL